VKPTREQLSRVRVCEVRCETCVFGPRSPISPARRREYEATWQRRDTFQNCHYGTHTGDTALMCRGFYDWCEAIAWWPTILQLAERLDALEFVPVPVLE
jgi:hypothetical protein